jgi:hypothetical protein
MPPCRRSPDDVGPAITKDKLLQLRDEGTASETLDFKGNVRPDPREDRVEGAKDVGAMQVNGGFIVIGADSQGRRTGWVTEAQAKLFDEATLRGQVRLYRLPWERPLRCG